MPRHTRLTALRGTLAQAFAVCMGLAIARPSHAQQAPPPPYAPYAAIRVLVVPTQEVTGVADARAWIAQFDSVVAVRLSDGGIANGWAYAHDATRYARNNPTYTTDPRVLGAAPLKNPNIKAGANVPQPLGSRVRTLVAISGGRDVLVPVVARLDTVVSPRVATLQLAMVDARLATITWITTLRAPYAGSPAVAGDSLAALVARLFIASQ